MPASSRRNSDKARPAGANTAAAESSTAHDGPEAGAPVPVALRVGGAFIALAVVFLLFGVLSLAGAGWGAAFAVSPRFLLVVLGAILVGAFATTNTRQRGSRGQVAGLGLALVLIIVSRLVSQEPLLWMAQYWLFLYAGAALMCALVVRRSLIPRT